MRLFNLLPTSWKGLWRKRRLSEVVYVASMGNVPEHLGRRGYIVGSPRPKWVILRCPCGCGDRIDINLMRSRRPSWRLMTEGHTITIHPSIWVPENRCGSHFWIQNNRFIWFVHQSAHNLQNEQ